MNPPVTHCRPTIRSGCWHVRTLLYVNSKDDRRTGRSGSSKPSLALNAQATSSESIVDVVCSTRTSAPQFFQGSSFEFAVCYKREDCYSLLGARGLTDSSGLWVGSGVGSGVIKFHYTSPSAAVMLFRGRKGGLQTGSVSINHEPKAQTQWKDLNDSWKWVTLKCQIWAFMDLLCKNVPW